MSQLFSPFDIGPLSLPNRIVVAPMCQYSSIDGEATDWHVQHWSNLALSGAGLVIVEATAVEPRGRISWADLGLYDDATEAAFASALATVRRWSPAKVGVQLAHAGRKASTLKPWEAGGGPIPAGDPRAWTTRAPSALPYAETDPVPEALDDAGIADIIQAFTDSATRAVRLGLDLIEIHAAHGYLLHEFLSPLSNRRSDAYGGSLENRMRLVLQVFDAIKAVVPDSMALGIRISATDWVEGGWDLAESIVPGMRGVTQVRCLLPAGREVRWQWSAFDLFALALHNVHGQGGLPILEGGEVLRQGAGNGRVAGDDALGQAAHRLQPQ